MKKNIRGIHILLSANPTGKFSAEELARIAVEDGAAVVQLREKEVKTEELIPIAKKIRNICRDITFIINDNPALAKIIEADGVHLGQKDMPIESAMDILGDNAIIGISCGSVEQAQEAEKRSADYIGFGHMFPTRSKIKSSPPKTLDELDAVCRSVSIPVIAIGGINAINIAGISRLSIGGIAVLNFFSNAENPAVVLRMLLSSVVNS